MKLCNRHWNELKQRVEDAGFGVFLKPEDEQPHGYDGEHGCAINDPMHRIVESLNAAALACMGRPYYNEHPDDCQVCKAAELAINSCGCGKPHDPAEIESIWASVPADWVIEDMTNEIGEGALKVPVAS